jgi:hypothetical protein
LVKQHPWVAGLLSLLLLVLIGGLIAHVAASPSAHRSTSASPASTAVPMVSVTITLLDVYCSEKEDALWSADHFYMLTAFTAPGEPPKAAADTQSELSQPLQIVSGQDLPLPLTVFNGLVPRNSSVTGGFTAYNDTQGMAWDNIEEWIADIGQAISAHLVKEGIDSANVEEVTAGALLALAINAWYATANLSSSNANELGEEEITVPASGAASEDGTLHFHNNGGIFGAGGWDYTAKYQITRTPA